MADLPQLPYSVNRRLCTRPALSSASLTIRRRLIVEEPWLYLAARASFLDEIETFVRVEHSGGKSGCANQDVGRGLVAQHVRGARRIARDRDAD